MFPFIPLIALIAILGGGATLVWYDRLTQEQKEQADRLGAQYARKLFGKALNELSREQANHVARLTKEHFGG